MDPDHHRAPVDPDYLFHDPMRELVVWFISPVDPLYVFGPTGSGKSSLVRQVAAKLNYPVFEVTGHGRLEFNDLAGHLTVENGSMRFQYGPLALAMKFGGLFLVNEIDLLDPATATGLNGVLDGGPLCIPENGGEVIPPHPMFRFVATANTNGAADDSGLYQGTLRQNLAFMDRFWLCEVGYPPADAESRLLERLAPAPAGRSASHHGGVRQRSAPPVHRRGGQPAAGRDHRDHLLDADVDPLGSKKVCNPEDLRIFATLKARAVALLERHGVRFLGGWALPEASITPVTEALEAIARDFNTAKQAFLDRYDDAIRQWLSTNPGWETLIAGSLVGVDTVRARLGFAWQMYRIVPPAKRDGTGGSLQDAVSGLGSTLFGEVAKVADEAWHKTFAGKLEVSGKALSPLRGLRQKLAGLTFVEPRVSPMVDLLDAALACLPDKGPINGADLVMLQGLVCLLRDPAAVVEHGQKMIDGQTPEDALRGLVALPADSSAAPIGDDDVPMDEDDAEPFADHGNRPVPHLDSLGLW